ncbi:MAG: ABC transporter permease, partial [Muribaculaceae bacterium]|nr:ABC transporter permease [Muribaculaceae bacterium]
MNILKTTIAQLREQRMLSAISITGTALSIFLIMVVVISQEVKVAPFAPVSGRDRMLHARYGTILVHDNGHYQSNGGMSWKSAHKLYDNLPGAEAMAVYSAWVRNANAKIPGKAPFGVGYRMVDDGYWKVFDHTFLSGKPFAASDIDSGREIAIIDESTAMKLFGTKDAAGRQFELDYTPTTVAGVVRDVTTLADGAFSQVWIPYKKNKEFTWNWDLMGSSSVTILAKDRDCFDEIRKAADRNMEAYNKEIEETTWYFVSRGRPYTQEEDVEISGNAAVEPDMPAARRRQLIIYA